MSFDSECIGAEHFEMRIGRIWAGKFWSYDEMIAGDWMKMAGEAMRPPFRSSLSKFRNSFSTK